MILSLLYVLVLCKYIAYTAVAMLQVISSYLVAIGKDLLRYLALYLFLLPHLMSLVGCTEHRMGSVTAISLFHKCCTTAGISK